MTAEIITGKRLKFSRENFIDSTQGIPEDFILPVIEGEQNTKQESAQDKEEHLHMFPPNGLHVPNVPRYESGFRNWHDIEAKNK